MLHRKWPIQLRMKSGTRFILRPNTSDFTTVYELFRDDVYRIDLSDVSLIVDLGGNVGVSALLWAERYPKANIIVFEPHPENIACFKEHIALNRLSQVELIEAAAGTKNGTVCFSGAGTTGRIDDHGITVPMVDFFEVATRRPIDLLKIDIEGGEYSILADPRFDYLKVRYLVMEWHNSHDTPDGGKWCTERLSQLGYKVRCNNELRLLYAST